MKVLVVGKNGQLARELNVTAPTGIDAVYLGRDEIDLETVNTKTFSLILDKYKPAVVINAAAYTDVDKAESEPEKTFRINADAVAVLARACHEVGVRLIHISTDFVFPGNHREPYSPREKVSSGSVYGESKARGEELLFQACPGAVCVRTSWLYSVHGNSFVNTMLRLMSEKNFLSVVDDQFGSPTWAKDLAGMLWQLINKPEINGILHWCNSGYCSWYEFASAINTIALGKGLVPECDVRPIPSSEYPTQAMRPAYSVLDTQSTSEKISLSPRPWQEALDLMLDEVARNRLSR